MPREHTNEEKARAVMARIGQTGNLVHGFSDDEHAELAAIYDECIAPEQNLADRAREFWGRRGERLQAGKATDDSPAGRRSFFRNRRQPLADPAAKSQPPAPN